MSQAMDKSQSRRLLDRARRGSAEAYGELVREAQDRLYTYISHLVACPAEAEDIVQEAFVKAFDRMNSFRGESEFVTWVYRIAVNVAHSRQRKKKRTVELDEEHLKKSEFTSDETYQPDRPLAQREQAMCVERALGKLSTDERAILLLRHVEDYDYTRISQVLGIAVGTVRSRLHRARERFRGIIRRELRRDEH